MTSKHGKFVVEGDSQQMVSLVNVGIRCPVDVEVIVKDLWCSNWVGANFNLLVDRLTRWLTSWLIMVCEVLVRRYEKLDLLLGY